MAPVTALKELAKTRIEMLKGIASSLAEQFGADLPNTSFVVLIYRTSSHTFGIVEEELERRKTVPVVVGAEIQAVVGRKHSSGKIVPAWRYSLYSCADFLALTPDRAIAVQKRLVQKIHEDSQVLGSLVLNDTAGFGHYDGVHGSVGSQFPADYPYANSQPLSGASLIND